MTPEEELTRIKKKQRREKQSSRRIFFFALGILFGIMIIMIPSALAAHDYYDVRPTIDSNPTHQSDYKIQQEYGRLKVIFKCGGNTLSSIFILKNLDANVSKTYFVDSNGQFDDEFSIGNYSVYLPDGNGGQPEPLQYLTINPQKTSYAVFLGHAISQPEKPKVKAKPTTQPTVAPTQNCHYHDGRWTRKCVGSGHHKFCFDIWIPGYWHCGGCAN